MNENASHAKGACSTGTTIFIAIAMVLAFGGLPSAKAEDVICPEAAPYQGFQLGRVIWTHEYSTHLLKRVQIGPTTQGTRILCEKLHGIVSTEIEGTCTFFAGTGRVDIEAEYGIKTCTMPPHGRRTNIEDCRVVCSASGAMVFQSSAAERLR